MHQIWVHFGSLNYGYLTGMDDAGPRTKLKELCVLHQKYRVEKRRRWIQINRLSELR
jgi:hypothetical protein